MCSCFQGRKVRERSEPEKEAKAKPVSTQPDRTQLEHTQQPQEGEAQHVTCLLFSLASIQPLEHRFAFFPCLSKQPLWVHWVRPGQRALEVGFRGDSCSQPQRGPYSMKRWVTTVALCPTVAALVPQNVHEQS